VQMKLEEIIKIRAKEEKIDLGEDALDYLTQIGVNHSLRYAVQLLSPALMKAKENGRNAITKEDVEHVKKLFLSVKESVEYIKEYEKFFLR